MFYTRNQNDQTNVWCIMGYEVDLQKRYPPWYKTENLHPQGGNASFSHLEKKVIWNRSNFYNSTR